MRIVYFTMATVVLSGAAGAAEISFTNTDSYIDATFDRPRSERSLREVQDGLRKAFVEAEKTYLAPGQTLSVEVTGVDLAGRLEPTFRAGDIRVMSGGTWPRLEFNYKVTENGAVIASGEARIHDMNYLDGFNSRPPGERLRYERQMLSKWFRKTFAKPA